MIRQAISCDICGTDKQQTNHWFVAYDQNGELRISDWNSQSRLRAGVKHLCGQTCLHKLVDEFMARAIAGPAASKPEPAAKSAPAVRPARPAVRPSAPAPRTDTSLTAVAAHPMPPRPVPVPAEPYVSAYVDEFESSARLIPSEPGPDSAEAVPAAAPAYASRTWRSDAWKREREREQRTTRRRSIA